MRILITVKTYPIPSATYDELVCTAGVLESGDFVRLYPVNFRDLPFSLQYRKYQWIEVDAVRHQGRDVRRESYRPNCESLRVLGEPIGTDGGSWAERSRYVLKRAATSLEELKDRQKSDWTSMGIFRPKRVDDLIVTREESDWKPSFRAALKQARLWDDREKTREPPRKVPYKFQYRFACEDSRCNEAHQIMIEDWEVGALYWRLRDKGATEDEAVAGVRKKFLDEICSSRNDTYFYVGTVSSHPTAWVVIGTYYPRKPEPTLFG